jgi:hypothetical protein
MLASIARFLCLRAPCTPTRRWRRKRREGARRRRRAERRCRRLADHVNSAHERLGGWISLPTAPQRSGARSDGSPGTPALGGGGGAAPPPPRAALRSRPRPRAPARACLRAPPAPGLAAAAVCLQRGAPGSPPRPARPRLDARLPGSRARAREAERPAGRHGVSEGGSAAPATELPLGGGAGPARAPRAARRRQGAAGRAAPRCCAPGGAPRRCSRRRARRAQLRAAPRRLEKTRLPERRGGARPPPGASRRPTSAPPLGGAEASGATLRCAPAPAPLGFATASGAMLRRAPAPAPWATRTLPPRLPGPAEGACARAGRWRRAPPAAKGCLVAGGGSREWPVNMTVDAWPRGRFESHVR